MDRFSDRSLGLVSLHVYMFTCLWRCRQCGRADPLRMLCKNTATQLLWSCLSMPGEAEDCTLVTSSLQLVCKKSKAWLQRANAQFRSITPKMIQRRIRDDVALSFLTGSPQPRLSRNFKSRTSIISRVQFGFPWGIVCHQVSHAGTCYILNLQRQAGHRCNGFCRSHGCGSRWSAPEAMPKGLPGGMCEGCQEDRDGLWDRQDASDEGVGQQCVR